MLYFSNQKDDLSDHGHCTLDSCCKSLVKFVPYVHLSVSSRQVKGDKNWFGFLHTRARLHEVSRGRQVKGLMIKVGAKITGDLISSSSLFSFTRGNGPGAEGVPVSHLEPLPFKGDKLLVGLRDSTHSSPLLPRLTQHFHCKLRENNL